MCKEEKTVIGVEQYNETYIYKVGPVVMKYTDVLFVDLEPLEGVSQQQNVAI